MKKSLVAVLLSLVALTLVAGAAFAGASFDVTYKVDGGDAKEFKITKWAVASVDVKAGTEVKDIVLCSSDTTISAAESVEFVLSGDYTLNVFTVESGKLVAGSAKTSITADTDFVLAATSKDITYAVKASVTYTGSSEYTPKPVSVTDVKSEVLEAVKKKYPGKTVLNASQFFKSEYALTSKDIKAHESDFKKALLYTDAGYVDTDGAIVVFNIKLTGIKAKKLLEWFSIMLTLATKDSVSIAEDTGIGMSDYFDDKGKEIMLNNTTTEDDQTVNVALEVKKAGRQAFGVMEGESKNSGGSPSGGCDMGLLGSLALFAVALLPLRKSR